MRGKLALGLVLLARPGNGLMAAVGALAGGLFFASGSPQWESLWLACAAAFVGVSGGNAINDAVDHQLDARAHPRRPVPRGLIAADTARLAGAAWLTLGVVLAALASAWAGVWAALLVVALVLYETGWKSRGIWGHGLVSIPVGGTFVLGALTATSTSFTWSSGLPSGAWGGVLAMAVLAFAANLARELYKSLQDAEFDLAWRETATHAWGPNATRTVAALLLAVALPISMVPVWFEWFPAAFLVWVLPGLLTFAAAPWTEDAGRSSVLVKSGMLLALLAFVAIVLI